jgi:hypothetical protein
MGAIERRTVDLCDEDMLFQMRESHPAGYFNMSDSSLNFVFAPKS